MTLQPILALLLGILACRAAAQRPVVTTIDSTWRTYRLPNARFTVTLPAGFKPRNNYGCYDALPKGPLIPLRSIRDVCVRVVSSDVAENASLQHPRDCNLDLADRTDCDFYEEVSADTLSVEGRRVILERGLRNGTIGHERRRPVILIRVALRGGSVGLLEGAVRGRVDEPDFLAAAGSLRQ